MDLKVFNFEQKNDYCWTLQNIESFLGKGHKISYFSGTHKLNKEKHILVKNINIDYETIKEYEIKQIKMEIYLLKVFKEKNYFPKLVDFLLSNDNKNLFILFEGNNIPLDILIKSKIFDYKKEKDLIKYIIYQIAFGLYNLHLNKIIHHDIKPSNILIDQTGTISIYNFLSAIYTGEKSIYYTPSYAAPELLISEDKIDEKYDMWALGVLMVELYLKSNNYFYQKNIGKENNNQKLNQLNLILSKFEIEQNYKDINIRILMGESLNSKNSARFKIEEISNEINDLDAIELIKNLLVINPKERFSAEQVLKSNYLKDFFDIDSLEIKQINTSLNYSENYQNLKDKNKFAKIIEDFRRIISIK